MKCNGKKITAVIMSLAMGAAFMTGCSGAGNTTAQKAGNGKSVVTVWAGGSDNVRVQFEKQIETFNASQDKYEAKLEFITSGTGAEGLFDRVVAAKKAGQTKTNFDVIELGGDEVTKYISEGGEDFFVTLDRSKIPNAENLKVESTYRNDLVIPYRGTTVVLAYNSDVVKEPPKTAEELYQWIKDHPGRFAYNVPGTGGAGDSFVRTTVYNYIDDQEAMTSDDPKWMDQWDEGFAKLVELHPYMYKSGGSIVYPNKNQGALDLLSQGEIDMCPMWADMLLSQRAAGTVPAYIKMATIQPSFTGSVQSMLIPNFGSNPDGAYVFINYMLSDAAQQILVKEMAAIPLVDVSGMDMTGYEDLKDLDVGSFRTLSIGDLGTNFNERWDNEIGSLG